MVWLSKVGAPPVFLAACPAGPNPTTMAATTAAHTPIRPSDRYTPLSSFAADPAAGLSRPAVSRLGSGGRVGHQHSTEIRYGPRPVRIMVNMVDLLCPRREPAVHV